MIKSNSQSFEKLRMEHFFIWVRRWSVHKNNKAFPTLLAQNFRGLWKKLLYSIRKKGFRSEICLAVYIFKSFGWKTVDQKSQRFQFSFAMSTSLLLLLVLFVVLRSDGTEAASCSYPDQWSAEGRAFQPLRFSTKLPNCLNSTIFVNYPSKSLKVTAELRFSFHHFRKWSLQAGLQCKRRFIDNCLIDRNCCHGN